MSAIDSGVSDDTHATRLASGRATKDRTLVDILILAAVPVLAALFSGIQLHPSELDPWQYYGYGTDLRDLLARYGWTYYVARIAWVYFLNVVFTLTNPYFGTFFAGWLVSITGTASLYLTLRAYHERVPALMAAFALAVNTWYLNAAFWLYVDGPAIALTLMSIACFGHGLKRSDIRLFCLSGAALTLAVNTHPISLVMVGSSAGLMLALDPAARTPALWRWLAAFAASAIAAMTALCLLTGLLFGNYLFFLTTISSAAWVVGGAWHQWVEPISKWGRNATALPMPFGVLLAGLIVYGRDLLRRRLPADAWICGFALVCALYAAFTDGVLHAGRLQHQYYFIYLWIPTFLLLGAVLARLGVGLRALPAVATAGGLVGLTVMLAASRLWQKYEGHAAQWNVTAFTATGALILVLAVGSLCAASGRAAWLRASAIVAGLTLVSFSTAADGRIVYQQGSSRAYFHGVVEGQAFIRQNTDPKRKLLVWYNEVAPGGSIAYGVNSALIYGNTRLNGAMPALADDDLAKMDRPATLAVIAATEDDGLAALAALHKAGLLERVSARATFGPPEKRMTVWMAETRARGEAPPSEGPPGPTDVTGAGNGPR